MRRRLTVAMLLIAAIALPSFLVTGCAYRRADRSLVQPLALSKKLFTGEWYYMKTIKEAPYESGYFTGQGGWPLGKKIRWEITEKYLYAFNASPNVRNTDSALTPVAAWPITRHFDIKPAVNYATGEPSNVIIEESRDGNPWHQRKYFRVYWGAMVISDFTDIFQTYYRWIGRLRIERANYIPPQQFEVSPDYMTYVSEEIATKLNESYYNMAVYEIPMSSSRIKLRHSFKKVKETDYTPNEYDDSKVAKFGNFRTSVIRYHPDRGIRDWSYKFYGNRHNVATKEYIDKHKADYEALDKYNKELAEYNKDPKNKTKPTKPGKVLKPRKIIYYLSPNFPKDLEGAVKTIAADWNEAMAYALQRPLKDAAGNNNVFDIRKNNDGLKAGQVRKLGDLRYNYLWYVNENLSVGLLGYGPSLGDPDTGEITHGTAYLYGGLLRRVVEFYMSLYDIMSGRYTTQEITFGAEYYNAVFGLNGQNLLVGLPGDSKMSYDPGTPSNKFVPPSIKLGTIDRLVGRLGNPQFVNHMKAVKTWDRASITASLAKMDARPEIKKSLMSDYVVQLAFPGMNTNSILGSQDKQIQSTLNRYLPIELLKPHNMQMVQDKQYLPSQMNMYMASYADLALGSFVRYHQKQKTPRDEVRKRIMNFLFVAVTSHEIGHTLGLMHNFTGSNDEWNYQSAYHDLKAGKVPNANADYCKAGKCPKDMQNTNSENNLKMVKNFYRSAAIMDYAGEYYDDNLGVGKTERATVAFIYNNKVEKAVADPRKQGALVEWSPALESQHKASMAKFPKDRSKWTLREFKYCSDYMVGQDPFCQRRDSGANAVETIQHAINSYDRRYPLSYYRRGRRGFQPWSAIGNSIFRFQHIASFYQDFIYKLTTQPGYRESEDFKDRAKAIQLGFNFLMRVLHTPAAGTHKKGTIKGMWATRTTIEDKVAKKVIVPFGVGRHFFSQFNDGYFGIFRFQRVGTLFDKWFALQTLVARSWGYYNNLNNWIYANFFDVFRDDTTSFIIQGMSGIWDKNSPLLFKMKDEKDPKITYPIEPQWHWFMQRNAMVYALALLNNRFSDRTFSNNMCVGIEGHGKSWTPPNMDKISCPPPAHLKDKVACFTNFLGTRNYFAVQNKERNSVSWVLVQRGTELAKKINVARLLGDRSNIEYMENSLESIETTLTIMQLYVSIFGGC